MLKKALIFIGIIFLIEIVIVLLAALFVTDREKWFTPGFLIGVFIIILAVGLPFRLYSFFKRNKTIR